MKKKYSTRTPYRKELDPEKEKEVHNRFHIDGEISGIANITGFLTLSVETFLFSHLRVAVQGSGCSDVGARGCVS